ncbi:hypothetical protein [Nostoc sp. CHAB 5715]|uniref:hypothetical protein n=1 Tax=Nostoc sp. CHAB 5715 TaxID=2780400 RepID=UPI001E2B82C4|nr:hypothetical protein [Nostoc sp. CHAB 5715]MCC5619990.1 hypothetical protein [Nostoc sp. CHAB 5715]
MSFWNDFAEGFTRTIKDIGTSVTRIVTDTAIDLGNVVTGFQFQDKMDEAKQTLKDAGLLSAADAIEKNYYSFLPAMKEQVKNEHDELTRLYPIAQNAERTRNDADRKLGKMLDDIKILAQSSLEAENLFAQANQIPYWQEWAKLSHVPVDTLKNLKNSCAKWDAICQKILISRGVANVGDGVAATTSIIISRIGKASAVVVKDAELLETGEISAETAEALEGVEVIGETAEIAGTVGRLAKIGELAGDASAILAVAFIGLDIGLSVAQLEDQEATLKKNINDLTNGIALANKDITDMAQETNQIHTQIQELLRSVTPPVEENNWNNWVKQQQDIITNDLTKLTSAKGIYERAFKMAKAHPDRPYDERIEDVQSIDDSITEDQAKQIISAADGTAPIEENITYNFLVNVISGSLKGRQFSGFFSYDPSLLKRKGQETITVLEAEFNYLSKYTHKDGIPSISFTDGNFERFIWVNGKTTERFGFNDGFGRTQFGRTEEAFIRNGKDYFGYLDENTYVDGAGTITYTLVY